jgi:hypothetical protein
MKATLEFDLPTEQAEFDAALEGQKWKQISETMRIYLRDKIEQDEYNDAGHRQGLRQSSEMLHQLVDDNGLNFD